MGLDPETITAGGLSVLASSVTDILPEIKGYADTLPGSVPVVVYGMDNCSFIEADGYGFTNKIKRLEYGKYHVVGELVVAP